MSEVYEKPQQGGNMTAFEKGLRKLIVHNFKDWAWFGVQSERRLYKPISRSTWIQKVNPDEEICEVYFKEKFLCDVPAKLRPDEALALIQYKLIQRLKGGVN